MKRDQLSSFAMQLRFLRHQKHLTQEDVATRLNLHRTTYTKYENDSATPDPECLVALSNLFEVSVDRLLGRIPAVGALEDNGEFQPQLDGLEKYLVYEFRHLTEEQKLQILNQVKAMTKKADE